MSSTEDPQSDTLSTIDQIQARRLAKRRLQQAKRDEQYALDLMALEELEAEHGEDIGHAIVENYSEGLPTLVVYRAPNGMEVKRYKARLRDKKKGGGGGGGGEDINALDELAHTVVLYPDRETFAKLLEKRPAMLTQIGGLALSYTYVRAADEGKD